LLRARTQRNKTLNKELKLFPRVVVYVSNMLTEEENIKNDENDKYNDYDGYYLSYKEY
jgi:hypothetical protein